MNTLDFDKIKTPERTSNLNFEKNLSEILETALSTALNNVNDKLLEWYDELSDEDKSLIEYEEFISLFKIELEGVNSGNPRILIKLKTPEELLEMYEEE